MAIVSRRARAAAAVAAMGVLLAGCLSPSASLPAPPSPPPAVGTLTAAFVDVTAKDGSDTATGPASFTPTAC